MTPWNQHDSKEFDQLIKNLPDLGATFGDKGYSSRRNCQLVVGKNGVPYLLFKDNTTSKSKGKPAWIISFRAYRNDTEEWLSVYHLRSIVEGVFSSIKRRWRSCLLSKKRWMQKKELSLKVLSYNIKQVLMVQHAMKCRIPLWKTIE